MLSWYENFPRDEIPPRWMWPFSDELEKWWKQVEDDREARHQDPNYEKPDRRTRHRRDDDVNEMAWPNLIRAQKQVNR